MDRSATRRARLWEGISSIPIFVTTSGTNFPIARLLAITFLVFAATNALAQTISITGAGSTFAYPLYSAWASRYYRLHPNVEVNYQSIGSGGGIRQLTVGTVDFGATDAPMTKTELAEAKARGGTTILHFPTALGADVPAYNIPGIHAQLKFTADALAGIYLGQILRWNDPRLQRANPGVSLPDLRIVVIHRSDGSGTTYCWSDYLSNVSSQWKSEVGAGKSVHWPVGLGGKGNEGVSGLIRRIPGSIGYIELGFAVENHILYGAVQNRAGQFIEATLSSVTAAAAASSQAIPEDFRVSIVDPPGVESYPISTYTWLLVSKKMDNRRKGAALKAFLRWGLTDGQKYAARLSYAPLPEAVVQKELKELQQLQY